jgi:Tfp pilus assembly protein PilN
MGILSPYYHINQAAGITIDIAQDGSYTINCCQVSTDHKQLTIEKKFGVKDDAEGLAKQLGAKVPIALNLSGKGILTKQVAAASGDEQQDMAKIIPNLNVDDFYLQQFTSKDQLFVSLVRKTLADHWINILEQQGFTVLMLSLGPFAASHMLNQLNVYESDVVFNGIQISRDTELNWTAVGYSPAFQAPFPFKIGAEPIDQQLIMPYAAAFQLVLADKLEPVRAKVDALDTRYGQLIGTKKLKVTGALILGVFFILLLLNFVTLSWLNSENSRLDGQASLSANSSSDMQMLTAQIKAKEALLKDMGWDGGFNKARLIDQLAALLPGEVTLKEIAINPPDINNKDSRGQHFLDRRIKLSGNSQQVIAVNEWIARIKTLKWVKGAGLDNFEFDNDQNTGKFNIIINY